MNAALIIFNLSFILSYSNAMRWISLFQIINPQISPVAPQETDQGLGDHPNLCFRSKMEIELSHSHHHLE